MEIKNLKKAAERILKAVRNKERIILYGDADPDGVASVVILKETIEEFGVNASRIYFPDREKEGYGLNEKALMELAKYSPALFITLDCGIANNKEVVSAKKLGLEVVVIDHHEVIGTLPKAKIIVDPKQKTDPYPFKEFACAGIVYKLAKELFFQADLNWRPEKFLELVLLATIADQMALLDENRELVKEGISALSYTKRPGILALIELTNFKNQGIEELREKIIPALNTGGPAKNHLNETYLLLTEKGTKTAKKIAASLLKKSEEKRGEIKRIFQEAEARIESLKEPIIFEGDKSWPLVLLGPVASRLCHRYKKPVFLFRKREGESPGAVRTPPGIDGVKAMKSCGRLLLIYGGHAPAAGFRLKNENLDAFKECLIKYFNSRS